MEDMLPAGSEIGINLFGFTNRTPTFAFAIPNRDPELPFLEKITQTQGIHTSDLQIAKLPGLLYRLDNKKIADSIGFEELIVLERDGTTYLFDELLSAQNYLKEISSDPVGESRRDPKMRELLENVRQPSQFQTVISNDFFHFILDQEIELIPKNYQFAEELTACLTKLNEQTKPMVICAGMHDQQWFLEAYATSDAALILDTVLLGIAIHKFMGF